MRTSAGKADHVGAGFLQSLYRIEVVDLACRFLERIRRIGGRLHEVAFVEQYRYGCILGKNRRLDLKSRVAMVSNHKTDGFHFFSPPTLRAHKRRPHPRRRASSVSY